SFISYSSTDRDFVRKLQNALAAEKHEAWVDWKDIPLTAEWEREITDNIEAADNFIFVMSHDSVASENCKKEINHAMANNKRIVPLLYRSVADGVIPETLARFQRIEFRYNDNFDANVAALIAALDTDHRWVKTHTRLLMRALEWEREGK